MSRLGALLVVLPVLAGCTGLEGCGGDAPPVDRSLRMTRAVDLDPEPDVVEVHLVAEPGRVRLGGAETEVWGYRDAGRPGAGPTVPGPMIEASLGDRLVVRFDNHLDDGTTIHFHGAPKPNEMDGAPMGDSLVKPGESFVYEFSLSHAGTFWYHPHWRTDEQLERGLYGQLQVHGPRVDAVERFFVIDDFDRRGDRIDLEVTPEEHRIGRHGEIITVNGVARPTLSVDGGSVERWHLTNACNARVLSLSLPGHAFTVIGSDGGLLASPRETDRLRLLPGERVDVVLGLSGSEDDEVALETRAMDRGYGVVVPASEIMTLRFRASGKAPPRPALPSRPIERPEPPAVERTFTLGANIEPNNSDVPLFHIDGQSWPFGDVEQGEVGRSEAWTIVNDTETLEPFHVHGTFMQVLGAEPALEDVVGVPPGGSVRVGLTFEREGAWMFHTHLIDHAEGGMMRVINVTGGGT